MRRRRIINRHSAGIAVGLSLGVISTAPAQRTGSLSPARWANGDETRYLALQNTVRTEAGSPSAAREP